MSVNTRDEQRRPSESLFRNVKLYLLPRRRVKQDCRTISVTKSGSNVEGGFFLVVLIIQINASLDEELYNGNGVLLRCQSKDLPTFRGSLSRPVKG